MLLIWIVLLMFSPLLFLFLSWDSMLWVLFLVYTIPAWIVWLFVYSILTSANNGFLKKPNNKDKILSILLIYTIFPLMFFIIPWWEDLRYLLKYTFYSGWIWIVLFILCKWIIKQSS